MDDSFLSFDHSVWSPGTAVTLANVLWDATYRDIPYFATVGSAERFIKSHAGPTITVTGMTYAAQGVPVRINVPFSEANRFNYLMVKNPAMPLAQHNRATTFFYFIHEVRYVAPNTTELVIQLDAWATYQYFVEFSRVYLERGHAGFHLADRDTSYGRDYLTIPEGFDLGNDYTIIDNYSEWISRRNWQEYYVAVVSTIQLTGDYGTVDKPKFNTAGGSSAEGLPNGANLYVMTAKAFKGLAVALSNAPWIAQGIVSVTIIPDDCINLGKITSKMTTPDVGTNKGVEVYVPQAGDSQWLNNGKEIVLKSKFRDGMSIGIPSRYRGLTKLLTYPYSVLEVTTYSGTPLLVKPETVQNADLAVQQWVHVAPPSPRIMFTVIGQNAYSEGMRAKTTGSEYFDAMTGITDLPTFSVVNNSYLQYMASNAHSIAYSVDSADWSQQKALQGASVAYGQATNAMNASTANTALSTSTASAQTALQNRTAQQTWALDSATNGLGALASGNVAGIAGAAVSAGTSYLSNGIQANARSQSTAISNNAANAANAISNGAAAYNRDTNNAYARYSAQGDYANAIAGINAKTQDARMIAPTTSGQVGGDAFNLATMGWVITARVKRLNSSALRRIGEYWLRYGYAVNLPIRMPSNFQCMSNFTYWKLSETYISSSVCPESFKQTIRGIFEKGVTVWNDASKIGSIDYADNTKVGSITL